MNYEQGLKSYRKVIKEICPHLTDEQLNKLVSDYKLEMMYQANDLKDYNENYDLIY